MAKVLIFSDLHIHAHKNSAARRDDCLKVLEWVFETALENNVESVIFAGDLFHDRQKIDLITYQLTFDIFKKYTYENKFDIFLLLGNHDLWFHEKCDVNSVAVFSELPNVTTVAYPATYPIAGKQVAFLPYTHNPIEDLKDLNGDILFSHLAIDGAIWNVMHGTQADVSIEHDGDMTKVGADIFNGWQRVFLGHYHAEQKLSDTVEYVGSPLQLSFGEAFQHKHIIIYDTETDEREYVQNTFSPQHFIIPESDLDKYDLENNFIRVVVDDIGSSDLIDIKKKITTKHNVGSLEIKQNPKEDSTHVIEEAKSILYKKEGMLEQYIKEVGSDGLDPDKLLQIGKQILNKAENK